MQHPDGFIFELRKVLGDLAIKSGDISHDLCPGRIDLCRDSLLSTGEDSSDGVVE
jgi:hypothetical protein